jgi:hypothetical protein
MPKSVGMIARMERRSSCDGRHLPRSEAGDACVPGGFKPDSGRLFRRGYEEERATSVGTAL